MQEPRDDRPALPDIGAVVDFMANILPSWQVYQFIGETTGTTVSGSVQFTLTQLPDLLKATALALSFNGFLGKPFRDEFRFSSSEVGASLLSSVVTMSASWLLNSSAAAAKDEKSDDLLRLSSWTTVSILLQFRYGNERGRCILILVTMRRWSETSPHSFTTVSITTSGSSVATTSRIFLPWGGSATCEVDLTTTAWCSAHHWYCPHDYWDSWSRRRESDYSWWPHRGFGDEVGQYLQEGVQRHVGWSVYVRDERAHGHFDGDELDLERSRRASTEHYRADVDVVMVDEGQAVPQPTCW